MRVRVTAEKAGAPARLASFRIEVQTPNELDNAIAKAFFRAVHSCLIHNTLLDPPRIEFEVSCPVTPLLGSV